MDKRNLSAKIHSYAQLVWLKENNILFDHMHIITASDKSVLDWGRVWFDCPEDLAMFNLRWSNYEPEYLPWQ